MKTFAIDFVRQVIYQTLLQEYIKNPTKYIGNHNDISLVSFYEHLETDSEVDRFVEARGPSFPEQQDRISVSWTTFPLAQGAVSEGVADWRRSADRFDKSRFSPASLTSWTARKSNQSILKEINPEYSLEGLLLKILSDKPMINLDSILKSRDISLLTNVCMVKAMIFPVVMYRCELDHKEGENQRINAFEV